MNTDSIADRVELRLAALGLTARKASLLASGGRNGEIVRNIRRGKSANPRGDTIDGLARALGCQVQWLLTGEGPMAATGEAAASRGNVDPAAPRANVDLTSLRTRGLVGEKDFPIYASAQGGPTGMIISFDPIEVTKRPEPLLDVHGGFGMYVIGDSMEPVYRQGDMILVHPKRPPGRGDDVLIVKSDGNGTHDALVKTLVALDDTRARVRQYNPPAEFDLPRADIFGVYLIVGSYRRR